MNAIAVSHELRAATRPLRIAVGAMVGLMGLAVVGCSADAVKIESATYAENCGAPVDVTNAVAASCNSDGCTCDKSCFGSGADPAPGCPKSLTVTYSSDGGDPQTLTCGPASNESYTFTVTADGKASCTGGSGSTSGGSSGGCKSDGDCGGECPRCSSGHCDVGYVSSVTGECIF